MEPIILWDMDDDPRGNVAHIAEHGVSPEEVESVLLGRENDSEGRDVSGSSGDSVTFGETHTGRYIVVVWQEADDDPWTVYPVTAYDVPRPRSRNRPRRGR